MLLGQDSVGDVVWIALYTDYDWMKDPLLQQKLGFGSKICIANPFFKIALDGRTMIRLEDDAALFIFKEKDGKKCRFCTKFDVNGSHKKCSRCQKAFYCSKECQTKDWKELKHKSICDAYVWISKTAK